MPRFAPWYRREEYALMREILHDGETLPLAFDEWEKNAESEGTATKRDGVNIIPVFIKPDEFFSFCQEKKIAPNRATAAAFASSRGAASYSMGL
jgi:hypothetical protein